MLKHLRLFSNNNIKPIIPAHCKLKLRGLCDSEASLGCSSVWITGLSPSQKLKTQPQTETHIRRSATLSMWLKEVSVWNLVGAPACLSSGTFFVWLVWFVALRIISTDHKPGMSLPAISPVLKTLFSHTGSHSPESYPHAFARFRHSEGHMMN